MIPPPAAPSPAALRSRFDRLEGRRQQVLADLDRLRRRLARVEERLALAPAVEDALRKLSDELFGRLARTIERQLTLALQEVLNQPIELKVEQSFLRGAATMRFRIERGGQPEDIMRGQGGSVANVLSVGLRIFALMMLDEKKHRRFLVLDEQDCWLAPDLVPRLVKLVRAAGRSLGFQVLMISHHSLQTFERYADRICRFVPTATGVEVRQFDPAPATADPESAA